MYVLHFVRSILFRNASPKFKYFVTQLVNQNIKMIKVKLFVASFGVCIDHVMQLFPFSLRLSRPQL